MATCKRRIWNKYEVISLMKSDLNIDFNNFNKDELIQFLIIVKKYFSEEDD